MNADKVKTFNARRIILMKSFLVSSACIRLYLRSITSLIGLRSNAETLVVADLLKTGQPFTIGKVLLNVGPSLFSNQNKDKG